MSGLKDKLADFGYGAGWALVCKVPRSWAEWAFRFFADIAWRREGPRVQILEANLVRVLGPDVDGAALRAASREVMRRYARYWLEIFLLPTMPVEELVGGMRDIGHRDTIFETLATGRGVVVGIPHMGNWDQAGAWIIEQGAGSFTTVAERLKPESIYDRFVAFREGLGMEVLPASGGARPFGLLAQRLRAGKMVILPCDRDITGSGIEVDFFGEKARMMPGPAALAIQTGAALVPAILWYTEDGWGIHLHPEIAVPADGDRRQKAAGMTQRLADVFAEGIRKHPADWHMLQPVFTADLDQERLAASIARAQRDGAEPMEPGAA